MSDCLVTFAPRLKARLVRMLVAVCFIAGAASAQLPVINEFRAVSPAGSNDWIEVYNPSSTQINLAGWYLTDNAGNLTKWRFPATNLTLLNPYSFLLVYASGTNGVTNSQLHADFKLNDTEYLALVGTNGLTVVHEYAPTYPKQREDWSYGIGISNSHRFFAVMSPGSANTVGAEGFVADTKFTPNRGFYTTPFSATLTSTTPNALIYYTTDGSAPGPTNGTLYNGPIPISRTTTLRAAGFRSGLYPTDLDTHSYIFLSDAISQTNNPAGFPSSWNGTVADYGMDSRITSDPLYRNQMTNVLLSLPTMSIAANIADLFGSGGIYANPQQQELASERPCSVEWINPDGTPGFHLNAGIRIYGGAFRDMGLTRKKSLRLFFKDNYGVSKLDYRVFDAEDAVESFDSLILRAGANDAYNNWGDSRAQYIIDEFVRDSQLAMGSPAPHGTFVHLYINGLYWGLYNPVERPEVSFSASYFGSVKEDWDAIHNSNGALEPTGESTMDTYNAMINQVTSGLSDNTAYQKIQGNNADRTRNPAYTGRLDVARYTDYMIVNHWAGTTDWPGNNWYAGDKRRVDSSGFKYYTWDAEMSVGGNGSAYDINVTGAGDGAATPYSYLKQNAEYRLFFADRVHKYCFNGGVMTTNVAIPRYEALASRIRLAMIGETARWGDQAGTQYTPATWTNRLAWTLNTCLPWRAANVVAQWRGQSLYPNVAAPVFYLNGTYRHGGIFTNGSMLSMTASSVIYYTLDGSDPRQYGTGNIVGSAFGSAFPLNYSVRVKARAKSGADWSAMTEADFVCSEPPALRVSEVMYNPKAPQGAETNWGTSGTDFEFVEVQNHGTGTVGLIGMKFTKGILFDFAAGSVSTLAPGEHVLVVKNLLAFSNRYGLAGMKIAGAYQANYHFPLQTLGNDGEEVELKDASGRIVSSFTYGDGREWPLAADGAGHSLVPSPTASQTNGDLNCAAAWRASAFIGGSPGRGDPTPIRNVVINEIMAHTDYTNPAMPWLDSDDWIELYNVTTSSVTLQDWYLSDDMTDLKKWRIPGTNVILAAKWLTFRESLHFHTNAVTGFGFNKDGDEAFLSYLPATTNDRVADCVSFKGQENFRSLGRYRDGGTYWFALTPTTNAANALWAQDVVISEIMYNPSSTSGVNNTDDEYIELFNPSGGPIALWNESGAWRINGGVEYMLPTGITLAAGARLVLVSFNPQTDTAVLDKFLITYGLTNGQVRILGPCSENLANSGERIALERPQAPDPPETRITWVIVDEVSYWDSLPWPPGADGTGKPLQRVPGAGSGNDPGNWYAGFTPTPGLPSEDLTVVYPDHGAIFFRPFVTRVTAALDSQQVSGNVKRVECFVDGRSIGWYTNRLDLYEFTLDSIGHGIGSVGHYQLTVGLQDDGGSRTSHASMIVVLAVDNVAGATNLTDLTADLRGEVRGGGSVETYVYWGTNDGVKNKTAWWRSQRVGPATGAFCTTVSGFNLDRIYYYRSYVTNAGREDWAESSSAFRTVSYYEWPYRMKVQFPGYSRPEVLTNFPMLVRFGPATMPGFSYAQMRSTNGYDLRFSDSTGARTLSYDIEKWNTNGESQVWVKVPELRSNGWIWAHWGMAAATAPQPYLLDGSTWSEGYMGVWHLSDRGARDSSRFGNTGISVSNSETACVVDGGLGFGGTGSVRVASFPRATRELTVSAWVWAESSRNLTNRAIACNWGSTATGQFYLGISPNFGDIAFRVVQSDNSSPGWVRAGTRAAAAFRTGQWWYVAGVAGQGTVRLYTNAQQCGDIIPYDGSLNTELPWMGIGAGINDGGAIYSNYWVGKLDEVQISSVGRSEAWIWASWKNQDPLGQFSAFDVYPREGVDEDGDKMPDIWEKQNFDGTNVADGAALYDWDHDGIDNLREYLAGTNPRDEDSFLAVDMLSTNGVMMVGFHAMRAAGAGYVNKQRLYDLEESPSLSVPGNAWQPIAGYTGLIGNDTYVVRTNPPSPPARFYRVKARLDP